MFSNDFDSELPDPPPLVETPREKAFKDQQRYLPRHKWYLADAQILIRDLQAIAWSHGWHVTLGGGVLNHGYSDGDLDIFVLPIYREGANFDSELAMLTRLVSAADTDKTGFQDVVSTQTDPHECYEYSVRFLHQNKPVELFIVKRIAGSAQ